MTTPAREIRDAERAEHAPARAQTWKTHAALAVVQVAFASGAVEGKLAMRPASEGGGAIAPEALAMLRMAGSAIFFLVVTRALGLRRPTTGRDQRALAGLSLLGIVLNQALYLRGLRLSSPVSAALIGISIPVFAATLAIFLGHERPRLRTFVGIALAVTGVVWLTGVRVVDRGAVLMVLNSLAYAAYLVFARGVIQRLGAFTVMTWIYVWAVVLFAPVGGVALAHGVATWSARAWVLGLYMLFVPTIVGYFLNAWALGRSTPTLVTIYVYVQPLLTSLLAWVQLGEGLSSRMLTAAPFILAGVGIVATRPSTSMPSPSPPAPR